MVEHNLAKVGVAGPSPVFRSFLLIRLFNFYFCQEKGESNIISRKIKHMNLYLRYFDKETLVQNVDDALNFLASIPEVGLNAELEADLREYANSEVYYPKRYKVRPRVYFIVIKTEAATMLDFKQKKALRPNTTGEGVHRDVITPSMARLSEIREGWYEGAVDFKRVVLVPTTGKHEYRDTHFVVFCKANSGLDCYNRIIDHLQTRVDSRSQFPSAKGKNFKFRYLGRWK